jgi:L-malate glycosyltransferase
VALDVGHLEKGLPVAAVEETRNSAQMNEGSAEGPLIIRVYDRSGSPAVQADGGSGVTSAAAARARLAHIGIVTGAGLFFTLAILLSRLRRYWGRPSFTPTGRVALLGTFYNTNWFLSHARPLTKSGLLEVLVITDEPSRPLDRVRFSCPPRLLVRALGRPLSRALWAVVVSFREKPDLFMGYHIIPNSVSALLAARILGRPACYQMTGGPIEIEGGGIGSENSWLTRLRGPSPFLERLGIAALREFDLVVVRGSSARRFVESQCPRGRVEVVPGSVDPDEVRPWPERTIDLLYVGRFTETKRPIAFVEIAAAVAAGHPGLRAVMIGEGPLLEDARAHARALGVSNSIEFRGRQDEVAADLGQARVFVLTSRTEGLSIAMAEAMMAGAVPVVARVGDLGDLVRDGENGYLVDVFDQAGFVDRARRLLAEPGHREEMSHAARESAIAYVGLAHVSATWGRHLSRLISEGARDGG